MKGFCGIRKLFLLVFLILLLIELLHRQFQIGSHFSTKTKRNIYRILYKVYYTRNCLSIYPLPVGMYNQKSNRRAVSHVQALHICWISLNSQGLKLRYGIAALVTLSKRIITLCAQASRKRQGESGSSMSSALSSCVSLGDNLLMPVSQLWGKLQQLESSHRELLFEK